MKIALACLAALLILPAPAKAGVPVAWQHKAMAQAEHTWRPAQPLRLVFAPTTEAPVEYAAGWAPLGGFAIYIDANREWAGYPEFCMTVLHEAGHAVGVGHRSKGIMRVFSSPTVAYERRGHHRVEHWFGIDRRCLPATAPRPNRRQSAARARRA